jgi:hypothetical protein
MPPENFLTGFPVEVITVTGQSGNSVRSIQAEVVRKMMTVRTRGALYINRPVAISGDPSFCGFNHNVAVPPGTEPMACVAWHYATDGLPGITTTGDVVDSTGTPNLLGDPAVMDTSSANPWYTLSEALGISDSELAEILSRPDHTGEVNPMHGITYIQGDGTINSNVVGSGLLYITGDATINGSVEYTGLIYVEGDLKLTGTAWVLGTLIVNGATDLSFSAGTAGVLYSDEALKNALAQAVPPMVLSWREL